MTKITVAKELKILKEPVWEKIQKYLPRKEPKEHYAMIREYPSRQGKYFRPALVLLSAEMFGGDMEKALLTAAAMQTSEDWMLIHDDWQDGSEERRSTPDEYKPALHRIFGNELAVNAGDALHVIMWKILGDNVRLLGNKTGWKVYDKFVDILMKTTEGQYLELSWIRNNRISLTEKEYYRMIYAKAGYYTVTGPLQLGAIVAGALDSEIRKIAEWGVPFGCAFQLWDDVMNLTIESHIQGKEIAGDILEGKRTLALIHLLGKCTITEKAYITSIYSKPRERKTEEEKDYVLNLMRRYGSIKYCKHIAWNYSILAKIIFDENTSHLPDTNAKHIIRECIDFVVNRWR
jgi:geranylgeranyl diphosphate synthase type II